MMRKEELVTGEIYHVMNKSIAGFKIFHTQSDYERMLDMIRFFSMQGPLPKFSKFRSRAGVLKKGFAPHLAEFAVGQKQLVQIDSYCLMPTHFHLMVKQLEDEGISSFMSNLLNTYARYFNTKRKRKGPLWVGRYKAVHVTSDEQATHLTRYIHLNPTTANLVKKPQHWSYSSYAEFVEPKSVDYPMCNFEGLIPMSSREYRSFVEDEIAYQKELGIIKHLVLE